LIRPATCPGGEPLLEQRRIDNFVRTVIAP